MTQRFIKTKTHSPLRNIMISVLLFIVIIFCFTVGLNLFSKKTAAQEKATLEAAVSRQIAHCYAMEGSYPESLDDLVQQYGLMYDSDRFFIDYRTQGSNIMPDVTIIDKEGKQ